MKRLFWIAVVAGLSAPSLGCNDSPTAGDAQRSDAQVSDAQVPADGPRDDGQGGDRFSFFVTSLEAMQKLSGSQDGFGGDLGGLAGADKICQETAATVGGEAKTWRAFLSVTKGPDGAPVHAIDRIGQGPWYDRNGRLVASDLEGLLSGRPDGDPQIINDLPDELGRGLKQFGDNHDVLTGSNMQGQLASTDPAATCGDWTSAETGAEMQVMAGHAWPRTSGARPDGGLPIRPDGGFPTRPDGGPPPPGFDGGPPPPPPPGFDGGPPPPPPPGPGGGKGGGKSPSGGDAAHWIMAHPVPGCAPGVNLIQSGGGQGTGTVGGGGGYGGIYCFALTP